MDFSDWAGSQPRGALKRVERESGAGHSTLHRIMRGERIDSYSLAERISRATGGAVSIDDLCRGPAASPESKTAA